MGKVTVMRRWVVGLGLLFLATDASAAGSYAVFGPLVASGDMPDPLVQHFSLDQPGRYLLEIRNGNADGARVEHLRVTVNGHEVLDPDDFTHQSEIVLKPVPLARSNELRIEAIGGAGSRVTIVLRGRDTEPPQIAFVRPAPDTFLPRGPETIELGFPDAASGVDPRTPEARINGELLTSCRWKEDHLVCALGALAEGAHTLLVAATDHAGNSRVEEARFVVDRGAPQVHVTQPAAAAYLTTETIEIQGEVRDGLSPIRELRVNGQPAVLEGDQFRGPRLDLTEGRNVIRVTAIDAAGNTSATRLVEVFRDVTPPDLKLSLTQAVTATADGTIMVSGRVTDESPVELMMNDRPLKLAAGAFRVKVTLEDGRNPVLITARDAAGNVTNLERIITFTAALEQPEAPVAKIKLPPAGTPHTD